MNFNEVYLMICCYIRKNKEKLYNWFMAGTYLKNMREINKMFNHLNIILNQIQAKFGFLYPWCIL